jgi:hypothetical protein
MPIAKFLRASSEDRWLSLEAGFWLALTQVAILVFPFRWIAPRLGRHMAESPPNASSEETALAKRIARAVEKASRHMPWKSRCLAQAIVGKMMLRRRGAASTLYLGASREDDRNLAAHAWLRCGETILTGANGRDRYVVVSTFAEECSKGQKHQA